MSTGRPALFLSSTVVAFGLFAGDVAHACSAPFCMNPSAYPATATLPANAGGIWLDPGFAPLGVAFAPAPGLRLLDGGASSELAITTQDRSLPRFGRIAVRTTATLPVGSTLTASANAACPSSSDAGVGTATDLRSWTIVEASPPPSTLGTLSVTVLANTTAPTPASGSCNVDVATSAASLTLVPSADATPWLDAFVLETLVDDAVFDPVVSISPFNGYGESQTFGGSWVGRGVDSVFARCGALTDGVAEGTHRVRMRGVLADGTEVTTEEHTVTLRCPSARSGRSSCSTNVGSTDAPWFAIAIGALFALRMRRRRL